MKKQIVLGCIVSLFFFSDASAQIRIGVGGRFGGGFGRRRTNTNTNANQKKNQAPPYKPTVTFSLGYSYPNLDKQLFSGSNFYTGNISQTNYINASIDYKYSPTTSLGLFVTHGKTNTSYYYDVAQTNLFAHSSLSSWSIMLNLKNYLTDKEQQKVLPYIRTAIGLNVWEQTNTDASSNKISNIINTPDLAYQISLGADLHITKSTSFFIEAGYGKYILNGGLKFKL